MPVCRLPAVTPALGSMSLSSRFAGPLRGLFAPLYSRGIETDCKIGFVGLGNMGTAMCQNLLKKGRNVMVKDINPKREDELLKKGAAVAKSNVELAQFADFIITMLPASHHVSSFYVGETGVLRSIKPGTIAIDCSTIDYMTPKHLNNIFEDKDVFIIDAPVSGGVLAAAAGTLTFMVGGKKEIIEKAKPILSDMGSKIINCGDLGSGQIAKICNNLILAITMFGLAETFHLGRKLGIDLKVLTSVINSSSGRCWASDTYHPVPYVMENVPSTKEYKAGFTSQMLLKDLEIAQRSARQVNQPLEIGIKTLEIYKQICETHLREKDFSVIYEYLSNRSYYDKLKDTADDR